MLNIVDGQLKAGVNKIAFTDLQVPVSGLDITINEDYDKNNFSMRWKQSQIFSPIEQLISIILILPRKEIYLRSLGNLLERKYIGYSVDTIIIGLTVIPGIAAEFFSIPDKFPLGLLLITWGWVIILMNYYPKLCFIFKMMNLLTKWSLLDLINTEGTKMRLMTLGIGSNIFGFLTIIFGLPKN